MAFTFAFIAVSVLATAYGSPVAAPINSSPPVYSAPAGPPYSAPAYSALSYSAPSYSAPSYFAPKVAASDSYDTEASYSFEDVDVPHDFDGKSHTESSEGNDNVKGGSQENYDDTIHAVEYTANDYHGFNAVITKKVGGHRPSYKDPSYDAPAYKPQDTDSCEDPHRYTGSRRVKGVYDLVKPDGTIIPVEYSFEQDGFNAYLTRELKKEGRYGRGSKPPTYKRRAYKPPAYKPPAYKPPRYKPQSCKPSPYKPSPYEPPPQKSPPQKSPPYKPWPYKPPTYKPPPFEPPPHEYPPFEPLPKKHSPTNSAPSYSSTPAH